MPRDFVSTQFIGTRINSKALFRKKWQLISWAQSFCFLQQDYINFHPSLPKGLTWHFIETKAIKHDYYSSLIMWTHKNSKGKYWVVSQKTLFFNAF